SMEGQATYLASWEAQGGWERGAAHLDAQLAVTPAAVQDVVARHLTLERLAVVSLRPEAAMPMAANTAELAEHLAREHATPVIARGGTPIASPALVGMGTPPE